jgi:ribosome-associated translation inhibitor RaiA
MDIIIQSLGFTSSPALDSFIKEKIQNLKSDTIVRANVTMYKGPASNPEASYCEIRLEVPGNDHFVKKQSAHFEVAISDCVEVLSQQISKNKNRISSRHTDENLILDILLEDADDSDVELEDVVK